jgi:outer membrane protein
MHNSLSLNIVEKITVMKKAPLIISIIALIGVILLFVNQFSSDTQPEQARKKSDDAMLNIAYVKLDTLIDSYHYYNDQKTELIEESQAKQGDLEARYRSLQRKLYEIQSQVQNRMMTPTKAEKQQQRLVQEEQKIMQDKQTYELEIMEKNQALMKEILDSIKNYVNIYNKDYGYELVMTNDTIGSTILYAEEPMDITADILKGMNERYLKKTEKEDRE